MERAQQYLQGGESLLSVDDVPGLYTAQGSGDELDDYGPEEVCRRLVVAFDDVDEAGDVLPERCPLPVFGPDVRTLEERDDETGRRMEDGFGALDVGIPGVLVSS